MADMVTLMAENAESSDAVVQLSWCVSPELIEELKEKGVIHPYLLISVGREKGRRWTEFEYHLVQLDDMIKFLRFERAGAHTIKAIVAYRETASMDICGDDDGDIFSISLRKVTDEFGRFNKCGVVRYFYHHTEFNDQLCFVGDPVEITVHIEDKFFARKPPAWLWWWVNLWFEKEASNGCQFRKRLFPCILIQTPLLITFYIPLLILLRFTVATAIFLTGQRGVDFKPIFHPFASETNWIWMDAKKHFFGSFFVYKKDGKERAWLFRFLSLQGMFTLLLAGLGAHLAASALINLIHVQAPHTSSLKLFAVWAWVLAALSLIMILSGKFENLLSKVEHYIERREEKRFKREDARREKVRSFQEERMNTLKSFTCETVNRPLTVEDLPKRKQTVYLRFQKMKAKICKQYPIG